MVQKVTAFLILALIAGSAVAGSLKFSDAEKEFLTLVDLIITYEERQEFKKKCDTHEERARYIETFWAKRDPDLTDNVNTFRKEWMARRDYATTHFSLHECSPTSLSKRDIFMLLGPPDKKSSMIDITLLGAGYRNRYIRFPPELWIYEKMGYGYKQSKLKVQFIATSAFGDVVSVTDRLTDYFLRNLKYRFITNPELDEAPLTAVSSADYQVGAGPSQAAGESNASGAVVQVGTPAPAKAGEADVAQTDDADVSSEADIPDTELSMSAVSAPAPKGTDLAVPTTLSNEAALKPTVTYQPDLGNGLGIQAKTSFFKSGADKRLVLGRIGFPLNKMDFNPAKNQFSAPFHFDYHLYDASGKVYHGDSLRSEVTLPNKRVLEKRTSWYSIEFALILPADRYVLKAQLTDVNSGKRSYYEAQIEVPPLREDPHATELVLMDPNVSQHSAKFNIRETPYNLRLTHDFQSIEKLYPVTELVNITKESDISTIEVQALDGSGKKIKTWDLYEGELTATQNGSFLVHPALLIQDLAAGSYTLRIEVELTSGDILLSETKIRVEE